jgi:hypothetical protein
MPLHPLFRASACARAAALSIALAGACGQPAWAQSPPPAEADAPATPTRRIDDRRPAAPTTITLWGRPVTLTGSWELSLEHRRNFDLNLARARDRRVREHEVKLEAGSALSPDLSAFVQIVGLHDTRHTQGTEGAVRSHALERGEMWLQWQRLGGSAWSLQLGRVPLIDRRAWWWDDDLDAARLRYDQGPWRVDLGLGRTVVRVSSSESGIDPTEQGIWRQWGQAGWRWAPRHTLEAFWLLSNDRSGRLAPGTALPAGGAPDPDDLRAAWLGLRASGEWRRTGGSRLGYWADLALLRGRETRLGLAGPSTAGVATQRRVRGRAFDIGSTYSFGVPLRPSLTLAHARGSGGENSPTRDDNFRQTGLHENKARIAGVKRLRRYGELLQPDLSNLAVTTVGTGLRVLDNSSLELVLHRYRQAVAANSIAASRLSQAPLGLDRDIGREWNLLLAVREWPSVEFTLTLGRFEPGAAFPADRRDPATSVELGVAVNF